MSKINGINHITFATARLGEAIKFYHQLLGLELIATWDYGAYLLAGNSWVCLSYDKSAKQQPSNDYSHTAFNIDSQHFKAMVQRIAKHNVSIWKENKSEGESLYILDPDFNKLELHTTNLAARIDHIKKHPYPGMKLYGNTKII